MTKSEVSTLRSKVAILKASTAADNAIQIGSSNIKVIVESMDDTDADALKSAAEYLLEYLQDPAAVVLGSCPGEGKVSLVAAFSTGIVGMGLEAGRFTGGVAKVCGGGGGGRPNFAQAGGRRPEKLLDALEKAKAELVATLTESN